MKWCMLMLLRNAGGRTRHGFRNATRAVRLPIDGALQPIVALDVAPGAVGAALAAYGSRRRACAGSVVVKGRARGSHERNQDGLGAQVLRADQLAPLLLAHALTGLKIACRPHEWDFGDAYGEEGAMALFGCGRDERGGMAGVGIFAASAALDRLLGVAEKDEAPLGPSWVQRVFSWFQPNAPAPAPSRAVVNPRISVERRDAFLAAVPLLKPLQQGEANASFACADFDVYCVKVSAAWSKNATLTSVAGAHSFQLARKVLRPQFDLVKAARPRPSFFGVLFCCRSFASSVPCRSLWCRRVYEATTAIDATLRVTQAGRLGQRHRARRAPRPPRRRHARGQGRSRRPRGRRLGPAPQGPVQGRRARRVLALPPGLPGEPRERDGARRRRLDRGPRGPARRRRRARRGRRVPRRPAAAAVCSCVLLVFVSSFFCRGAEPTEPMFETGPRRRHRRGTPSTRGLMTQQPRETCYHIARHRRDQTRQRCARRRATPRSNAHVDAIARDLDVMASATAIFFSPASSMALLGAALAPEDVHLFEVCFAASFCPF